MVKNIIWPIVAALGLGATGAVLVSYGKAKKNANLIINSMNNEDSEETIEAVSKMNEDTDDMVDVLDVTHTAKFTTVNETETIQPIKFSVVD